MAFDDSGFTPTNIGLLASGVGAPIALANMTGLTKGLFGNKGPDFSGIDAIIKQRQEAIQAFSDKLEQARNSVLANYNNLQTKTMSRFTPALEASLAGRGLSVNGGAFNSGVGAEAGKLQSEYDNLNTGLTENNLNTIGQMETNLFGTQFGVAENKAMLPYAQSQSTKSALFGLAGTGIGAFFGGPMGAKIGQQAAGAVAPNNSDAMSSSLSRNWWSNTGDGSGMYDRRD